MKWNVIAFIAVFAVAFLAGWQVNGWRMGEKQAIAQANVLTEKVNDANKAFNTVNTKLGEVITKADTAANSTQQLANELMTIRKDTNKDMERISVRTGELQNEINKLGLPKCQFDAKLGSMWQQIGKTANSGRHSLYSAESGPAN
jgi:DNA repair ATPase RecN